MPAFGILADYSILPNCRGNFGILADYFRVPPNSPLKMRGQSTGCPPRGIHGFMAALYFLIKRLIS